MVLINVALTVLVIVAALLVIDIVYWLVNKSIPMGELTNKIVLLSALVLVVVLIHEHYLMQWFNITSRTNDTILVIFLVLIMLIAFLPYIRKIQTHF